MFHYDLAYHKVCFPNYLHTFCIFLLFLSFLEIIATIFFLWFILPLLPGIIRLCLFTLAISFIYQFHQLQFRGKTDIFLALHCVLQFVNASMTMFPTRAAVSRSRFLKHSFLSLIENCSRILDYFHIAQPNFVKVSF